MKQITCAELGGPATCTTVISGVTADEMISAGWKHLEENHPDVADNIKKNPKEVNEQWMMDFRVKFETLPEA